TRLSWRAMMAPQLPGLAGATTLVVVMMATAATVRAAFPEAPAWLMLAIQMSIATLFYAAFIVFSPFSTVKELLRETAEDLVPPRGLGLLNRLARMRRAWGAS